MVTRIMDSVQQWAIESGRHWAMDSFGLETWTWAGDWGQEWTVHSGQGLRPALGRGLGLESWTQTGTGDEYLRGVY